MSQNKELWKKYHVENDKPYAFTRIIKEQVKLLGCNSVLELGCGYGNNLATLDIKQKIGVDSSKHAIDKATKRYPEITFIQKDIQKKLSLPKSDLVFTCAVLEHLKLDMIDYILKKIISYSQKYVMFIEAFDKNFKERPIQWHRNMTFNTLNLSPRIEKLGLKIISNFALDEEYYLWVARIK